MATKARRELTQAIEAHIQAQADLRFLKHHPWTRTDSPWPVLRIAEDRADAAHHRYSNAFMVVINEEVAQREQHEDSTYEALCGAVGART